MTSQINRTFLSATKNQIDTKKKSQVVVNNMATEMLKAIFKNDNKNNVKNDSNQARIEIDDKEKEKILEEKLNELTQKYNEKIFKKITGSIESGYNYSHVPFYRNDFKGWDKFVIGGYDNSSPKQCVDIFIKHLINIKIIPEQIKWDLSSFDNKKPNKGINSVKFSWIEFSEADFELFKDSESEGNYSDTEKPKDQDFGFIDLIPDEFISKKSPTLEYVCDTFILFNNTLKSTKIKNFRLKSDEIVIRLKINDDIDKDEFVSEIVEDSTKIFTIDDEYKIEDNVSDKK